MTIALHSLEIEAAAQPTSLDERLMRLALALGERHLGLTWPNPSVGAVIVEPGPEPRILAQGITQSGGRPHAERVALAKAGEAARGATLYVSLEPCSHHGRTPPCAEGVIEAGIARVVSAIEDPDPRVSGHGHTLLRQAGIDVLTGVRESEARRAHRGHITRVTKGRPAVTVKLARTADGFAARATGARLLITGEDSNRRVHLMRAHADAILVGVATVMADDPLLTVRLPGLEKRSPVRVVLDSRLRTPLGARVVVDRAAPTWIVTTTEASADAEKRLVAAGVEVIRAGSNEQGRVDLAEALHLLAARGITRLFAEAGPVLADALAQADLVDEVAVLTSSAALAEPGVAALGPNLESRLGRDFTPIGSERLGADRIAFFERAG